VFDAVVHDGQCDVIVVGEVDLNCADDLAAVGVLHLADPAIHSVIVDLAAVTFLDSTGIGALVRIRNAARESGKSLALRNPSDSVMRVLKITGLHTVFAIERVGEDGGTLR
jgi:anti-anti-sigma factor